MEDRTLTITTENGDEILCEILFTTHSEEFKKDYVVFVEKGTQNASAASYVQGEEGRGTLEQIKTEEEWKMLEELLDDYLTRKEKEENDSCDGSCSSCSSSCDSCSSCSCDDELND